MTKEAKELTKMIRKLEKLAEQLPEPEVGQIVKAIASLTQVRERFELQ